MLLDSKIPGKIALLEKTYDGLRYASVQPISMDYAETSIHYRGIPPQDSPLEWRHILPGQAWGDSWITAWFRGSITLPESLHGQTVFLRATTGAPESMLLIDGQHSGMFDPNHPVRVLALSGVAGHTYDVHLEGYAGHTFPGTQPYDNPIAIAGGASQDGGVFVGKNSRHFQGVELVTERADVSAFVYELRTLRQLAATLEENSLRRGRIQVAMQEIFTLVYAKPEDVCEEVWRKGLGEARSKERANHPHSRNHRPLPHRHRLALDCPGNVAKVRTHLFLDIESHGPVPGIPMGSERSVPRRCYAPPLSGDLRSHAGTG